MELKNIKYKLFKIKYYTKIIVVPRQTYSLCYTILAVYWNLP